KLDELLAGNPEAQKYVTKLYYVPESEAVPDDATHVLRFSSMLSSERALRIGIVAVPAFAAFLDAMLALLATQPTSGGGAGAAGPRAPHARRRDGAAGPCPLAREIEAVARLHDLVSHGKKLMPNPTVVGLSLYANAPHGKFSTGLQSRAVRGPEESPTLHLHPDEDGTYAILSPDQTEWFSFNADGSPSWR